MRQRAAKYSGVSLRLPRPDMQEWLYGWYLTRSRDANNGRLCLIGAGAPQSVTAELGFEAEETLTLKDRLRNASIVSAALPFNPNFSLAQFGWAAREVSASLTHVKQVDTTYDHNFASAELCEYFNVSVLGLLECCTYWLQFCQASDCGRTQAFGVRGRRRNIRRNIFLRCSST